MLSTESVLATPLLDFEGGFGFGFTPWDELSAQFPPLPPLAVQEEAPVQADAAQPLTKSGSGDPDTPPAEEERRIRRKKSNRESARRSRIRKQRHLEELRAQVDRLSSENRELANRLGAVTGHCLRFCRENDRLRSVATALRRRLCDLQRVLILRRLQRLAPPSAPAAPGGVLLAGIERALLA